MLKELLEALIVIENNKTKLDEPKTTTCFETLKNIEEVETLVFEDTSSLNIDKQCSDIIYNYYENLDSSEKIILEKLVNASDKSFLKVLELSAIYSEKDKE